MRSKNIATRLSQEIDRIPGGITVIAKRLGKARNTIYNWCDKGNIPADQLVLLEALGVDVLYVISGHRASGSGGESVSNRYAVTDVRPGLREFSTSRREACEEMLCFIEDTLERAGSDREGPSDISSFETPARLQESVASYSIQSTQLPPAVMAIGRLFFDLLNAVEDIDEQRAVLSALTGSDDVYQALKSHCNI